MSVSRAAMMDEQVVRKGEPKASWTVPVATRAEPMARESKLAAVKPHGPRKMDPACPTTVTWITSQAATESPALQFLQWVAHLGLNALIMKRVLASARGRNTSAAVNQVVISSPLG